MLTVKEALKSFKSKYPDLKVTEAIDLNRDYYVFTAPNTKDGEIDFNDPFYAVSKKDGKIFSYSPTGNLDEYTDAIQNRSIALN